MKYFKYALNTATISTWALQLALDLCPYSAWSLGFRQENILQHFSSDKRRAVKVFPSEF